MSIKGFMDQNGQVQKYDFEALENAPSDSFFIPPGGSINQVLAKNSAADRDVKWVTQSGGGSGGESVEEVFWATYNTTSSSAIETAYQSGKICLCRYNDFVYRLVARGDEVTHIFVCIDGATIYVLNVLSNAWISQQASIPSGSSYIASNQGAANAGKFMVVGSNGIVTPVAMSEWQGGSY